jgi:ParB-like chromosome segregation protein Spo0J
MPKNPPESQMRLEFVPLSVVQRWPRNPKKHDEEGLDDSIERFGYVTPMLRDETTGKLVGGHGRLEALQRRKAAGQKAPKRIVVKGDEWYVPVVCGIAFDSESEAEAYLLADNKIGMNAGWDEKMLAESLANLEASGPEALRGIGWSTEDIQTMVSQAQLADLKLPPIALAQSEAPVEPRGDKFWVWVPCETRAQQEQLLAAFGKGKGRELDVHRMLEAVADPVAVD